MFDTICTLPLSSELFAQAIHPTAPLIAVGLSSGHVATLRLPPVAGEGSDSEDQASVTGRGQVEPQWRTRRHKGSCRSLQYSLDGSTLFSAGTDGIVKAADAETGRVFGKIAVPLDPASEEVDEPSLLHVLSPQTLLLATDSSALHLYDTREANNVSNFSRQRPSQTHHPHSDYISSLTPLPPSDASTSGYSKQWVTTGGTTLSVTDLRRGVLVVSDDQEEILLSSTYVSGLPARRTSTSKGEKLIVGGGDGVLTLWERGVWDDQDERITVDRSAGGGESLDCLRMLPDGIGPGGKILGVGMGDGNVRFVKLGQNKVVGEITHDEVEGVVSLEFDVGGRLITAGGSTIKVWHEKVDEDNHGYVDGAMRGEDEESEEEVIQMGDDSDDDNDDNMGDSDSDSEDEGRKRRKKRKRSKAGKGGAAQMGSFAGLD